MNVTLLLVIDLQGTPWGKKTDVSECFFWRTCGNFPHFFNRVFEHPLFLVDHLLQNAQKHDKKIEQNNQGRKKKTEEKIPTFL
jgi:hypothetical protein